MIRAVSISNFRGFESLEVNDMNRLTLFSGRNNVGKSSLLESLFLIMDHSSSESFARVSGFRGSSLGGITALWEPLFYQMDTNRKIEIQVCDNAGTSARVVYRKDRDYLPYVGNGVPEDVLAAFRSVAKSYYSLLFTYDSDDYHEEGHFFLNGLNALREIKSSLPGNELALLPTTRWLSPGVARLSNRVLDDMGNLELRGEKGAVVSILRELDPKIEDIVTLSVQGITQLYLRMPGGLIPIQYAGDGVMRLLQISMAAMELEDGILLIDELEAGFHYSMYGKLWSMLDRASASSGCQIIATTHSYEMISAVRGNVEHGKDFSYFRLGRGKKGHAAHGYSYAMLGGALDAEMEVR